MNRIHQTCLSVIFAWLVCTGIRAEDLASAGLPADVSEDHPLLPAWDLVSRQLGHIRANVRDYSCRLVKRERIDGQLQQYRFINAKVRLATTADAAIVSPFAVSLRYLGPKSVAGRRVLFVEGENDGRMLVRQSGLLRQVTLKIGTQTPAARRESLQPITDIGFERMALSLLEKLSEEMRLDPAGENTRVDQAPDAKIDGRACTYIRVTHLKPQDGLTFHIAEVFLDDELRLPVRVASYDWPATDAVKPALISEYNYTRLKLNVGFADSDFDVSRFEQ